MHDQPKKPLAQQQSWWTTEQRLLHEGKQLYMQSYFPYILIL